MSLSFHISSDLPWRSLVVQVLFHFFKLLVRHPLQDLKGVRATPDCYFCSIIIDNTGCFWIVIVKELQLQVVVFHSGCLHYFFPGRSIITKFDGHLEFTLQLGMVDASHGLNIHPTTIGNKVGAGYFIIEPETISETRFTHDDRFGDGILAKGIL